MPVDELVAKDSVITHGKSGRTTTYGKIAALAARTPHPQSRSDRDQVAGSWTLMGTEQLNRDVPAKVTGETVYAIDVRLPGMKWAAVKSCPVYGGDVRATTSRRFATARRRSRDAVPDPRSEAHARPRFQWRRGRDRR